MCISDLWLLSVFGEQRVPAGEFEVSIIPLVFHHELTDWIYSAAECHNSVELIAMILLSRYS